MLSFNEKEFKLQKLTDRANSTFNEELLFFIIKKFCDGEKVSAIRRSFGTEYHRNAPHKVHCKTDFLRVANRLKTCCNSHPKYPFGRPGYSDEGTERVAIFFHENNRTTVRIAAEELNFGYATCPAAFSSKQTVENGRLQILGNL